MGVLARTGAQDDEAPLLLQRMAEGGRAMPWATGTVHVEAADAPGVVDHYEFDEGRLVARTRDAVGAGWALVRPGPPDAPWSADLVTAEELAGWSVRVGGGRLVLPPLDDVAATGEGVGIGTDPPVPDADLALRLQLVGSPAGTVRLELAHLGGRRVAAAVVTRFSDPLDPVPAGAAEATLTMTWRSYLRLRAGDLDPLEAVADGAAEGHWTHLLLVHGLFQDPGHAAAWGRLPEVPEPLRWFGEVAPWLPAGAQG